MFKLLKQTSLLSLIGCLLGHWDVVMFLPHEAAVAVIENEVVFMFFGCFLDGAVFDRM